MPEPAVVIRGERLNVGYRRRAVFRDLSFEIRRGDILGIVGPNGSGKTTLVRTILGLNTPLDGHVSAIPRSLSATCRSGIGWSRSCRSRRSKSS